MLHVFISELIVKDIINSYPQDRIDGQNKEHEAFYKPSYHLEDCNEAFSEGLEQETKVILEKVDVAIDQTKSTIVLCIE